MDMNTEKGHDTDVKSDSAMGVDHEQSLSIPEKGAQTESQHQSQTQRRWYRVFLSLLQIETHGIEPIPREKRTDTRLYEMFFVWFSANLNVLAFSTGTVGPTVFGLGIKESFTVIIIVDLIAFLIPAFFGVFGPKTGMRTMVQARYSFGYYGSILPSALNVFTLQGFLVLNCIIGGQTLAAVSDTLSWNVGIVIIAVISLFVTFCGYRVVHWYESIAWIPNVIAFITMLGVGGKLLFLAPLTGSSSASGSSASVASIISFATTLASTDVSWCTMVADYGVYHDAEASSWRIFIYTYLGFAVSSIITHLLGAAFACAAPLVPAWEVGYAGGSNVGGLITAVLSPSSPGSDPALKNFGSLLTVLVALSVPSACAPTMYSFGTSAMNVLRGPWFARHVPRNAYAVVSFGILIPLAILGAKDFYSTFVDLFSIIGYWTASFAGIVLTEHVLFRRRQGLSNPSSSSSSPIPDPYQRRTPAGPPGSPPSQGGSTKIWDTLYPASHYASRTPGPGQLPPSAPGLAAFLASCALVVPFMAQVWYTGPVAARRGTGDLGLVVAFVCAVGLYALLRGIQFRGECRRGKQSGGGV